MADFEALASHFNKFLRPNYNSHNFLGLIFGSYHKTLKGVETCLIYALTFNNFFFLKDWRFELLDNSLSYEKEETN